MLLILFHLQPPIQVYGLAGNYAAALYSAGKKAKELDRVTEDISQVPSQPEDIFY